MFSRHTRSLPVVMHHFVSKYPGLSMSPEMFEENCCFMAGKGWRGVTLGEAESFFLKKSSLPPKTFLLTLDDGYLDNYLYAWPILEKYGHAGVIFAVADCVSAADKPADVRPTLSDVWQGVIDAENLPDVHKPVQLNSLGYATRTDLFFNWSEARRMEASGKMAIAGHSLRHEAVFTSSEFEGFRSPGSEVVAFNRQVKEDFWGCPRFKRGPELAARAFVPNPQLVEKIKALVPQNEKDANEFFRSQHNLADLEALVATYTNDLGRFESNQEQKERIYSIMANTQKVLQKELGHKVKSFCWPWGARCQFALEAGKDAGFEVFYNVSKGPNPPGNPEQVNRFKARKKTGNWLLSRSKIYSRPLLGKIYSLVRI